MDPFTMAMLSAGLAMQGTGLAMQGTGVGQQRGGMLGGPPQFPQIPYTGGNMNKTPFMMPDPYKRNSLLGGIGQQPTNNQYQYNPYSWWRM